MRSLEILDNQNLHAHLSISNGDHTGDPRVCRGIFGGFMGLLFFGYLLTIVVHGHISVEKPGRASPFCNLGICARVWVQGVERDK